MTFDCSMMVKKFSLIIIFLSVLVYSGCSGKGKEPPRVEKGVIDLSGWDLSKDGPIKLSGEWEFYWKTLISPVQCLSGALPEKKYYLDVPSVWISYAARSYPQFDGLHKGYGTYLVNIKGLSIIEGKEPALMLKAMQSAYSLFFIPKTAVPGIISKSFITAPLMRNGVVATSEKDAIPQYLSQLKRIPFHAESNFIIIHMSNYYFSSIAFSRELILGTEDDVQRIAIQNRLFSFFVIGIILFMAIYHILLYLFNRNFLEYLIFGLICFFISVWYLLWDGYISELFPEPSYVSHLIIENATTLAYAIVLPLFASFFRRLFKDEMPLFLVALAWIETLLYLIIRVFKLQFERSAFFVYNILIIVSVLIGLFVLIKAVARRKPRALITLSGFFIFGITVSHDILQANLIIFSNILIAPFGLVAYILSQSFIFTKTYANLAEKAEIAAVELLVSKYNKTYLAGIDIEYMKNRLKELMEEEKLYHDETLSIRTLAHEMSLTIHQLSELLNNILNINFNNYINSYRVKEAKIILREDITRSILSIAYDVGFNSATSFYRTFKKLTGKTPQEFRCEE